MRSGSELHTHSWLHAHTTEQLLNALMVVATHGLDYATKHWCNGVLSTGISQFLSACDRWKPGTGNSDAGGSVAIR